MRATVRWAALGVFLATAGTAPGRAAEGEKPLPEPRLLGPRSGKAKDAALSRYGGDASTEKAVEAGLDWLLRHQERDGSWDGDGFPERCAEGGKRCDGPGKGHLGEGNACPYDDPLTGLAALAFLGHGHAPDRGGDARAQAVERALRRLERASDPWGLAFATEAFAEAEAMERKGRWREAALRGARTLLEGRQKDGGWAYIADIRPGSDTPYTAAVVPALVAARDAGVELPADLAAGVDRFLGSLEEEKGGRLAYLLDGRKYGYTPTTNNGHLAAALRELLEVNRAGPRHRLHMSLVADTLPAWSISFRDVAVKGRGTLKVQVGNLSLYQWYYGTLASFQSGGTAWPAWWSSLRTALVGHQRKEGCVRGSWDPEGMYERLTGGRVFATAMAVLMLEAPYRHRRLAGP